jgi:aspartate beta-hydroxylase
MTDAVTFLRQAREQLQRGEIDMALGLIGQAEALTPNDPEVWMARAVCLRAGGQAALALEAAQRALALDPYHFFAHMTRAGLTEQLQGRRAAARLYKDALKIAPPADRMPPPLRAQAEHAAKIVAEDAEALAAHIAARLKTAATGETRPTRFDESVAMLLGRTKPFVQEPLYFHYPQLPAIPFYPREMFPWFAELEAATMMIRGELDGALAALSRDFKPYIQFPAGAPVNQWTELNHSARWSTLHLWRDGTRIEEACAQCPHTAALLTGLPMAHQTGFAPTAMFSRLDPHTTIPPHTGSSNIRLIAHLPLVLPGPARFRVGNETRAWRMGEAWVFDDTIEHEAWNDAGEARVILIFDVWNPFLSEAERALVSALMLARREYYAG